MFTFEDEQPTKKVVSWSGILKVLGILTYATFWFSSIPVTYHLTQAYPEYVNKGEEVSTSVAVFMFLSPPGLILFCWLPGAFILAFLGWLFSFCYKTVPLTQEELLERQYEEALKLKGK